MDVLGERQAVLAGHDWGAPVAWSTALLRPDRIRGVIGLSVAYRPRGSTAPVTAMHAAASSDAFYMVYFQEPGIADAELMPVTSPPPSASSCSAPPATGRAACRSFRPAAGCWTAAWIRPCCPAG